LQRLRNYGQLKEAKVNPYCLINVGGENKRLSLSLVTYVQEELNFFRIGLNSETITQMNKAGFDFSDLEYSNITKKIKKSDECDSEFTLVAVDVAKFS